MTIYRLLLLIAVEIVALFIAIVVVERSVTLAFKGLKLALKSEFTSAVGRLNLIAMILLVVVMLVFNLHETVAKALSVQGTSTAAGDSPLAAIGLLALFFMGSLICVLIMERKD